MKKRWLKFWHRIKARGNPNQIYKLLVSHYTEPHRAYHTLSHIAHCLKELNQVQCLCPNPDAVEMALWFHDFIYNTKSKNNEKQSAQSTEQIIKQIGMSRQFAKNVSNLILATRHHKISKYLDTKILTDIDLAILGQPPKIFDQYEKHIRQEYNWVPEDKFKIRRAAILRSLLQRQQIYTTKFFQRKYELQARKNLSQSLKYLEN